jgi:hypothetical protein
MLPSLKLLLVRETEEMPTRQKVKDNSLHLLSSLGISLNFKKGRKMAKRPCRIVF